MSRVAAVLLCLLLVGCAQEEQGVSAWTRLAPMKVARSEHPAVVLGDRIVVLGGLVESAVGRIAVTATVEAYDLETENWVRLEDLPEPRHHVMAAVVGDRLYSIGGFSRSGFTPTDQVWELVDGSWAEREPLPEPVGAGAAVVMGTRVFVVGGSPGGGMHVYDSAADTWETLAGPTEFREHLAAVAYQGEIWAIAGRRPGLIHETVEIYDPGADRWRPGPSLRQQRSGFGAVVVGDSIYVAGGEIFDPDRALDSTERFDPVTGAWEEFESIPVGLHGNPLVEFDGALMLPGGSTRAADVENAGELWSFDFS